MRNIEDDVKILKDKDCLWNYAESDILEAIENILSDYTRQKQINEEHQKINGELRERVKELDTENNKLLKELYNAHCIISDLSNFKGGITMLSEDEKKAIENLKDFKSISILYGNIFTMFLEQLKKYQEATDTVLKLITKLQKENEEKDNKVRKIISRLDNDYKRITETKRDKNKFPNYLDDYTKCRLKAYRTKTKEIKEYIEQQYFANKVNSKIQ